MSTEIGNVYFVLGFGNSSRWEFHKELIAITLDTDSIIPAPIFPGSNSKIRYDTNDPSDSISFIFKDEVNEIYIPVRQTKGIVYSPLEYVSGAFKRKIRHAKPFTEADFLSNENDGILTESDVPTMIEGNSYHFDDSLFVQVSYQIEGISTIIVNALEVHLEEKVRFIGKKQNYLFFLQEDSELANLWVLDIELGKITYVLTSIRGCLIQDITVYYVTEMSSYDAELAKNPESCDPSYKNQSGFFEIYALDLFLEKPLLESTSQVVCLFVQ